MWFTTITPQGFNSPSTFAVDDQCIRLRDCILNHGGHIHIESKEKTKRYTWNLSCKPFKLSAIYWHTFRPSLNEIRLLSDEAFYSMYWHRISMYTRHLNWIWVLLALLDTRWHHRYKYTPHITIILIITTPITNI